MFGLFKNKKSSAYPSYKVLLSEVAKYRHIIRLIKEANKPSILIYHFENTGQEMKQLLNAASVDFQEGSGDGSLVALMHAEEFINNRFSGKQGVIVCEIYPLSSLDLQVLEHAHKNELAIEFYSAIDSMFFNYFGDGKLKSFMTKLGFGPDEVIDHILVAKTIRSAQKRLEDSMEYEVNEKSSIEAWMEANVSL